MKFSDIFVPRWQNSNPEVRKKALERIKDIKLLENMKAANNQKINKNEYVIENLKKLAKASGTDFRFEERHGKGSHGRLYYGDNFTTLKDRKNLTCVPVRERALQLQ